MLILRPFLQDNGPFLKDNNDYIPKFSEKVDDYCCFSSLDVFEIQNHTAENVEVFAPTFTFPVIEFASSSLTKAA